MKQASEDNMQRGPNLDRRDLMKYALYLLGSSAVATTLASCAPGAGAETYFSASRRAVLDDMADLMIPETDTPGARTVGVADYVDRMVAKWASKETRDELDQVLDEFRDAAREGNGESYLELEASQRLAHLKTFDATRVAGASRSLAPSPYTTLKELLLTAYYLSEIGATQELRYEAVPGPFRGDIPLSEVGRAWAV